VRGLSRGPVARPVSRSFTYYSPLPPPRVMNSLPYPYIPIFAHPVQWRALPPRPLILAPWAPNRRPNIGT
jgi:hypothetical protein